MQADIGTGDDRSVDKGRPSLRIVGSSARVVIADRDAARRAALLDELTQTMPEVTTFLEASTLAELLEHAAGSRMAIVAGALADVPAQAAIRILAQRFPDLHVVDMAVSGSGDM